MASPMQATDYFTYPLRRVGIVPVMGMEYGPEVNRDLHDALLAEFSSVAPFEIVRITPQDVSRIPSMNAWSRGWYRPDTILTLASKHSLDGLLIVTVTDRQPYPPQRLGLTVDLVAAETGMTLWSSTLYLDASKARVRGAMEAWSKEFVGDLSEYSWESMLVSPKRFARFGSYELARGLPQKQASR